MDQMLQTSDFVGVTFWIISVSMVASTFFFFAEANNVGKHWGTSVRVAGLITLIAAVHYYYMRDVWVATGETPTVYRYIDWLLTVPLQMIEFYLINFIHILHIFYMQYVLHQIYVQQITYFY